MPFPEVTQLEVTYPTVLEETNDGLPTEATEIIEWPAVQGLPGPQGDTGPAGPTGAAGGVGPAGADGADGSTWYSGSAVPSGGTGANGDYYFQTSNSDVHKKTAGVWAVIGNLEGAQGIQGPAGATGATGAQGPQGIQGVQGPQGIQGIQGEQGLAGAAGDTYKTTSSSTILVGNGTKTLFTDDLDLDYTAQQPVLIADGGTTNLHATVTSYNPATGELVVDVYKHTGSGSPSAWTVNLEGVAGAEGAQGPQGIQGPQGDQGIQGIQGIQGVQGVQGDAGPQGIQGATGATGATGPAGADGVDAELIVRQATGDEVVLYDGGAYNDILPAALPAINLEAGAVYSVEIWMRATQGATATAKSLKFTGGTATFTRGHFSVVGRQAAINTLTSAMSTQFSEVLDGVNVVSNAGSIDWQFHLHGLLVVDAAGTFMPQLSYITADPTGTITFKAGTYVRLTKVTNYNA